MNQQQLNVLISGTAGSTAYNLAHPGSDVDKRGVFAAPTSQLLSLMPPPPSLASEKPDVQMHELTTFIRLALRSTPGVLELLWLPGSLYDKISLAGQELIGMRNLFPSASRVQETHLGFARGQVKELGKRNPQLTVAQQSAKHAKCARHLYRVLHQGFGLYSTGRLTVRLTDDEAQRCFRFGREVAAGDVGKAEALVGKYVSMFKSVSPALPAEPEVKQVNTWLVQTRIKLIHAQFPHVKAAT